MSLASFALIYKRKNGGTEHVKKTEATKGVSFDAHSKYRSSVYL
ncbi:hypothetical protein J40TS1_48000 [Paenibacillus montaniterrae]|uniref:Uncharacterized protein n=1 Tax=Paenibacillus montaniterrae TaxID=429341 RepID=A0A919YYL7_9BACL|nr:hypothetical protein J40TS1_48000 [Paenibacillus montaniterrae]